MAPRTAAGLLVAVCAVLGPSHRASADIFPECASRFDPRWKGGVARNQIATYHPEYMPWTGGSITVNCDDMAKTTLGEGNDLVAAMYIGEYGGGARCGSCVLVEGPHTSVVVTIIDKCECGGPGSQLDLSPEAFRIVSNGNFKAGKIPISWKTVSCDINYGKTLHYRFKEGSTAFWMQLSVAYSVDPIKKIEVLIQGKYYEMAILDHGYWGFVNSHPPMEEPLQIRLTSTDGELLNDQLSHIEYSQSILIPGKKRVQFTPGCPVRGKVSNTDTAASQKYCGGGDRGNGFCKDSSLCCSNYGYCGKSEKYCEGGGGSEPKDNVFGHNDNAGIEFKVKGKTLSCKWASRKPDRRCGRKIDEGGRVRNICPMACS